MDFYTLQQLHNRTVFVREFKIQMEGIICNDNDLINWLIDNNS